MLFVLQLLIVAQILFMCSPDTLLTVPGYIDCGLGRRTEGSNVTTLQDGCCKRYGYDCVGADQPASQWGTVRLVHVEMFLFGLMVLVPICCYTLCTLLEGQVLRGIQALERSILRGMEIEPGSISFQALFGVVNIEGLYLKNPPGYKAPYLLHVGRMHIDVNMAAFWCSCCRTLVVDQFDLDCVDIIFEKHGDSSNLHELEEALRQLRPANAHKKPVSFEGVHAQDPGNPDSDAAVDLTIKGHEVHVIIHKVSVTDIGARVQGQSGVGARINVKNLHYDNLAQELGKAPIRQIVKAVMGSILKSTLANVVGHDIGERLL